MKPLVDSVQFFDSAILAKFNIVNLRCRSVDYPPTQHCAQNASPLWNVAQAKFYAHRLEKIRGNIGGACLVARRVTYGPYRPN